MHKLCEVKLGRFDLSKLREFSNFSFTVPTLGDEICIILEFFVKQWVALWRAKRPSIRIELLTFPPCSSRYFSWRRLWWNIRNICILAFRISQIYFKVHRLVVLMYPCCIGLPLHWLKKVLGVDAFYYTHFAIRGPVIIDERKFEDSNASLTFDVVEAWLLVVNWVHGARIFYEINLNIQFDYLYVCKLYYVLMTPFMVIFHVIINKYHDNACELVLWVIILTRSASSNSRHLKKI